MQELRKQAIPLVVAFTPNYFVPAATCLYSILEHSDSSASFRVICLLTEELPDNMKLALQQLDKHRLQVTYINLKGRLRDIYVDGRYTVAAFYRLLLPDLLPEYDKVLYVDCDVVVRNDIVDLYDKTDLTGYYLAAVFEASLNSQLDYLDKLGVKPGHYINSGFLLMNLQKLRTDGMVGKLLHAAKTPHLQFPDQDVLNQLCAGKILGLPPYYNSIRTFYLPQYKHIFLRYYTEIDWQAVQEHGTIHYTGGKPWDTFTVQFAVWWHYYERLPKDIKSKWKPNKQLHCLYKIYNTAVGKYSLDSIRQLVRRFKYGIS
ncbi:glycosyltransferase family 8 protein [Sphingobacterium phlebotomi]|uniref:Glycosyltransferase family 8 protein n=1 Tax=Sphingobacterium phlebotomi TaxID=2605433 RepID=A0A5D4H643_9SPHI|nr:glycosyltransferase family 8 protein [Sphingobacterium phlebotomi]TYR36531.1 glycosyltransferase family 8 protein [Sphingobacterium phlebotomi]